MNHIDKFTRFTLIDFFYCTNRVGERRILHEKFLQAIGLIKIWAYHCACLLFDGNLRSLFIKRKGLQKCRSYCLIWYFFTCLFGWSLVSFRLTRKSSNGSAELWLKVLFLVDSITNNSRNIVMRFNWIVRQMKENSESALICSTWRKIPLNESAKGTPEMNRLLGGTTVRRQSSDDTPTPTGAYHSVFILLHSISSVYCFRVIAISSLSLRSRKQCSYAVEFYRFLPLFSSFCVWNFWFFNVPICSVLLLLASNQQYNILPLRVWYLHSSVPRRAAPFWEFYSSVLMIKCCGAIFQQKFIVR